MDRIELKIILLLLFLFCSSTIYYEDMTIILNDLNVDLIDAKPLNYYEWESIYRNSTYLKPKNFIKIIKNNNISKVYYFISNCQSANVVNFYFKNQNQSFECVIIYEQNHVIIQSCQTRDNRIYALENQTLMIIIVCICLFGLYILHKRMYHSRHN